ncbi:MAG: ribosome-associated translation inhibitor RaiA [Victivallales bacterium]|nr:ribosome-associated translation inhibitor RaiA [Victivallales bacterium]
MSIIISGRHFSVSEEMKAYTESRIQPFLNDRYKISSVRVILELEKNRHKAEIIVHAKNCEFEADCESMDMYESIDLAVAKIGKQINKHFDKKQDHHKAEPLRDVSSPEEEEDEEAALEQSPGA